MPDECRSCLCSGRLGFRRAPLPLLLNFRLPHLP